MAEGPGGVPPAPDWRPLIHRICYQGDDIVVTACGAVLNLTRQEVRDEPSLTLTRGKQTCPECEDYGWPLETIRLVIRQRYGPPVRDDLSHITWIGWSWNGEFHLFEEDKVPNGVAHEYEDTERHAQDIDPAEDEKDHLLYWAWTIIANAGEGDWTKESTGWQKAARDWRDRWHRVLDARRVPDAPPA